MIHTGEIWPMVVEKAYAKVAGSYEAIGRGGRVAPALETLTGGAAWSVDAMTIPWKDLRRAVEDNDVVAAWELSATASTSRCGNIRVLAAPSHAGLRRRRLGT